MKLVIEILLGIFALMMLRESILLFICMWVVQKTKLEIPVKNFGRPALICLATFGMTIFIIKLIYYSK